MTRNIWTFRLTLFTAGSMSIGSLLLYFFGFASFSRLCIVLSTLEVLLLLFLSRWAWRTSWSEAKRILARGLWAGCLATLAYDIVRVPIVHAGIPVFKAISYFGTVLLGQDHPTAVSELLGWGYHLSNGVSFALMYAALAVRPGPITAVLWGLSLEGAMLLTPYAEVFGYQRNARFFGITIGSHAVYGFVLWLALRKGNETQTAFSPKRIAAVVAFVSLGLFAMAADANRLYARKIPQSPPAYIGPHLYTVWNVPEPDRVAVIWVMKRFVDRDSSFHFIEPFEKVKYGQPFDIPEANVRRSGTLSATQVLMDERNLKAPKLDALAHMTQLTEVTPWMLASDSAASQLAEHMRLTAESACGKSMSNECLGKLLQDLDDWYKALLP